MASPVWFITGTSNGMGQLLAMRALKAGHKVIGTVRNPTRSAEAVEQIKSAGGDIITLDLEEPRETIFKKVGEAAQIHGRIDYLVNNAAYSLLGPLETFTESEVEKQFRANVFGTLYVIQAALPTLRKQKSGTIVNFSSVAGQNTNPGIGAYGATKAAVEAMSEALSKELTDFGIEVLIIEPGIFRTNFFNAIMTAEAGIPDSYRGTPADKAVTHMQELSGKQPGDPTKLTEKSFQIITGEGDAGKLKGKVLRFVIGQDAIDRIDTKLQKFKEDMAESQAAEKALSTAI